MTASAECEDMACTRRRLLAGAGALTAAGALQLAAPQMAFAATPRSRGDLLVVLSLRGGADGLSLVPPVADHDYQKARPDLGVRASQALHLDRTFGLHPGLRALMPFWTDKRLAIVHAVGDSDGSRSHFEAADNMERGVNNATAIGTGWLDRHMVQRGLRSNDFPALAVGRAPGSLAGPAPALSMYNVRDLRIRVADERRVVTEAALAQMYKGVSGAPADAARQTLDALRRFAPLRDTPYVPRSGVTYPTGSNLSHRLQQIAQTARAGVGLEVATLDMDGWDTHQGMGVTTDGYMHNIVQELGNGLAAFARDLGPLLATTTIVTMTEFGRRVGQNGSGGVDHGHGSAMMVLGGGIRGGRVYGRWPGLGAKQLESGDLAVTTDYRDVLGELVRRRLGGGSLARVFPDHTVRELGLARQR